MPADPDPIDAKAKQILLRTYWRSGGWIDDPVTEPAALAYAKDKRLMFDALTLSHDALVARAIAAREGVSQQRVALAFAASLSTRRLYLRSALGSYANLAELRPHAFTPRTVDSMAYLCGTCAKLEQLNDVDLNVLNFERFKFGGVRHEDVLYNALDLELLAELEAPTPTASDAAVLRDVLNALASSEVGDTPAAVRRRLKGTLKANKDEIAGLLELLRLAGVCTLDNRWKADDYNADRVHALFGDLLR